ncbi:MAG: DUF4870 domain-containing protein [Stackebrandtia sp.]
MTESQHDDASAPEPAAAAAGEAPLSPKERSDASTANYLGLLFLAGPFGWIGPLIYRGNAGAKSDFVRRSATAAMNFHLSLLIYEFSAFVVLCGVGVFLFISDNLIGALATYLVLLAVSISETVFGIVSSVKGGSHASRGEIYGYPGALRLIKE